MVKKGLTDLGVLVTQQILLSELCVQNNFITSVNFESDALCNLVLFEQFRKCEKCPWILSMNVLS